MKICIVGSLISLETFDKIVSCSRSKPSNAPENFQMMLVKGLYENGITPDIFSFPNVATYPNSPYKIFRKHKEKVFDGIESQYLPMINFPFLKQISIYIYTYLYVKKWINANKDEDCYILLYSDYPPYAMAVRNACKNTNAKSVLIMTDFPTFYLEKHKPSLNTWLNLLLDKNRLKNFSSYDMYIVLTKHMVSKMKIKDKPYIVIEGFSDFSQYETINTQKSLNKSVMYCGALSNVHNIGLLVDSFKKTTIDAELWIYGSGNKEDYIKQAANDDARIRFFGKVSRKELLTAQKQSHLLISVKSKNDEHTNYAFPSKILEYMTSGTAVLTTRVGGIPEEYFEYLYTIDDESVDSVAEKIEEFLSLDQETLQSKGRIAQAFVVNDKNCFVQAQKILNFLKTISEKNKCKNR